MSRYKTLISYMFVALWLTNNRLGQKKKGSGRRRGEKRELSKAARRGSEEQKEE